MSSLVIEVCEVSDVQNHPDADRMCVVHVKGWRVCSARNPETNANEYRPGDKCVYFPPDSVLPPALAEEYGVVKYAPPVKNADGSLRGYRIKVARLRNFPSYGFIAKPANPDWSVGRDVAAELGVTKWEPPVQSHEGDAERDHPAFHRYFTLEHWRNFPGVLVPGERIVVDEKLHGMNVRAGLIREPDEAGQMAQTFMVGSHDVRRKEFATLKKRRKNPETGEIEEYELTQRSRFWDFLSEPVKAMLRALSGPACRNVVIFGEMIGSKVQDMTYGHKNGAVSFRVFDITVDGQWLDSDAKKAMCDQYQVPTVPHLYDGPYSPDVLERLVTGPTTACDPEKAGKFKGREGVVVRAATERRVVTDAKVFDRAALKVVSFDYLERKGGSENH
jgi:RNA ligase (TIGR02306 family)